MEFDAICADISKHWGASPEATLNGIDHSYPFDRVTRIDPVNLKMEQQKVVPLTPQNAKQTKPRAPKASPKQTVVQAQKQNQMQVQRQVAAGSVNKETGNETKAKPVPKTPPVKITLPKQPKTVKGAAANTAKEISKGLPQVTLKQQTTIPLESQPRVTTTPSMMSTLSREPEFKQAVGFQRNDISFEDVCASLAASVHARIADAYVQQQIINGGALKSAASALPVQMKGPPAAMKPAANRPLPAALANPALPNKDVVKVQPTKSPKPSKPRANAKKEAKTSEPKKRKRATEATPKQTKSKASEKTK